MGLSCFVFLLFSIWPRDWQSIDWVTILYRASHISPWRWCSKKPKWFLCYYVELVSIVLLLSQQRKFHKHSLKLLYRELLDTRSVSSRDWKFHGAKVPPLEFLFLSACRNILPEMKEVLGVELLLPGTFSPWNLPFWQPGTKVSGVELLLV